MVGIIFNIIEMRTKDKIYQTILKQRLGKKKISNNSFEIISQQKNIPYLLNIYKESDSLEEKKFILDIFHIISRSSIKIQKKNKNLLKSFLSQELDRYDENYSSKIEIAGDYELNFLGEKLLEILKNKGNTLKIYELDTLIFMLGFLRYFPAQKYIKLYINSKHESVKYCAEKALKSLKEG